MLITEREREKKTHYLLAKRTAGELVTWLLKTTTKKSTYFSLVTRTAGERAKLLCLRRKKLITQQ